jgi:hypothetical protein
MTHHQPEDDRLPLEILHKRDTIISEGKIEQDYRFLDYRFKGSTGEVSARMYLDDCWSVSVFGETEDMIIDNAILDYLKRRFRTIKRLGGPEGYTLLWEKKGNEE